MKRYLKFFLCIALVASGFLCFPASSLSQGVEVWTNLGLYGGQINDIAIDHSNTDVMFVAVDYFGNGGAIHKSVDGGDSFTKVMDGVNQDNNPIAMYVGVF